jgi:hypothetical protein
MRMQNSDPNAALYALSPDCTRDEWVKIAMAYKAAGGDFNTFDAWSREAPARYDARNCMQTWNGIQLSGGITAATLYRMAKDAGYICRPTSLTPVRTQGKSTKQAEPATVAAVYEYRDKSGRLRALNIRYEPKDFRPRYANVENPDASAYDDPAQCFRRKPEGFSMPLYHEDQIARRPGETVYFTEGEKDADNLARLGYLTSCHKSGGGVIRSGHGLLNGRQAVIIADADEPGAKYAEEARENLTAEGASVAVITPPGRFKDYSEWEEAQDSAETWDEVKARFELWGIPKEEKDTCETLADVWDNPPPRSPELITGLLRQGHKMIVSGTSKAGKSFALLQLAAALAEGRDWLQTFSCKKSTVLYLNLEIDRASMIHRAQKVYEALAWTPRGLDNFIFDHLRGRTDKIEVMAEDIIAKAKRHNAQAVFIDPVYKCGLEDENSAGDIAQFCRILDRIATETGAAVIYCHHFSKGAQDGKSAIDRASGSGVFARDADAILTLTELQEQGGFRLDCILREFKNPKPMSFRFEYPLHILAPELDECPLKGTKGARQAEAHREAEDKAKRKEDAREEALNRIAEIGKNLKEPVRKTVFVETVMGRLGIGKDSARAYVAALLDDGRLIEKAEPEKNNRKLITAPVILEEADLI